MKKNRQIITGVVVTVAAMFMFASCNSQLIDTTYHYDTAIIRMPDGSVVTGKVQSWKDYGNSDSIQIKIDGMSYYTHIQNVVLISK